MIHFEKNVVPRILKLRALQQLKRTSKVERSLLGAFYKLERLFKKRSMFFEKVQHMIYLQDSCSTLVELLENTENTLAKREAFFRICRESLKLAAKNLAAKEYLYVKKIMFVKAM